MYDTRRRPTSIARRSVSVEPLGRPGVRIELLLPIVEPGHPFHEGDDLPVLVDLGLVDLAGSEPLVLLGELGGKLGDRLEVGLGELAALQETREGRGGELGPLGQAGQRGPILGRRSCSGRRSP